MRLIRLPEVLKKTGCSRSRIYADPLFPKRVQLGPRSVAWVEDEIDDWVNERIAQRDEQDRGSL